MRLLIENYISVFLVTICALLCTSFIKSEIDINNARDFHSYCIAMIETSDFDSEAIQKCNDEAEKRGYTLTVTSADEGLIEKVRCGNCGTVFSIKDMDVVKCPNPDCKVPASTTPIENPKNYDYFQNRICTVELKYSVKMKILGIEKEGVLSGYAR